MTTTQNTIEKQFKNCPACNRKTPIDECIKITSRSSGKTTTSWRCTVCYNIRKQKQAMLKK